jgi:hypothetical protein
MGCCGNSNLKYTDKTG